MKRTIAAVVAGVLATLVAMPAAAGQAVWEETPIEQGGVQFRLSNHEGAAILLQCLPRGSARGSRSRRRSVRRNGRWCTLSPAGGAMWRSRAR